MELQNFHRFNFMAQKSDYGKKGHNNKHFQINFVLLRGYTSLKEPSVFMQRVTLTHIC